MFDMLVIGLIFLNGLVWISANTVHHVKSLSRFRRSAITNEEIQKTNNCKCVKYFQCDDDNYIIKDGKTLFDVRSSFKTHTLICPEDDGTPHYCCFERLLTVPSDLIIDRLGPGNMDNHVENLICGQRSIQPGNSGNLPEENEYPWMAAVYVKNHFVCTGALIHPSVVLTAAHYINRVKDKSNLRVTVGGGVDLSTRKDEERKVIEFIIHPQYVANGYLYNDIGLLILEKPYDLNNNRNIICLPSMDLNFENSRCESAGWNRNDPKKMQKVDLPFVGHDQCQYQLRTYTELGANFSLHESFICAGGEKGKDVCKGDGGSPLMCAKGNAYFHVGIVSWGKGCQEENVPGAYTNVANFKEWIFSELSKKSIFLI